ncbi:AcrR family transcriptional regulator [Paenibacillus eucommiae]|uniref:AcrR family transcriptional regulator n=1 Tax=Paenibacillus eucommiae TaxID=1355755 RepID=A0ABS4J3N0_9BACL|nr:AcrR family transcriptional regulator [Paenibacillus eucommiae]
MSIIRQNIMESAARYFSEHGYAATSIQEIADDCGIAKGSLYKFFQSKEDLFIAFHEAQQEALYTRVESIRADAALSLREVFILETECHFEFFLNNKFIMHDIKQLDASKGPIAPYFLQLRANLLKYSKEGLIRLLGEQFRPNIWDLVIMYNGIVREFIFLLLYENKPLNIKEIAVYIVDRVEEMAACIVQKKTQPLLSNTMMNHYMQCEKAGKSILIKEYRTSLLANLLSTTKELSITNFRKEELSDAITMLQEELAKESHKSVLVHALLDFVGKEHELKPIVRQLERYVCVKQA